MNTSQKYPYPCCGYKVFEEPPGSNNICPICFWEDDISQLRYPDMAGGANYTTLIEAQKNYEIFGACEKRHQKDVRPSNASDIRDNCWRKIDIEIDSIKGAEVIINEVSATYPKDFNVLYYWRSTYWRPKTG